MFVLLVRDTSEGHGGARFEFKPLLVGPAPKTRHPPPHQPPVRSSRLEKLLYTCYTHSTPHHIASCFFLDELSPRRKQHSPLPTLYPSVRSFSLLPFPIISYSLSAYDQPEASRDIKLPKMLELAKICLSLRSIEGVCGCDDPAMEAWYSISGQSLLGNKFCSDALFFHTFYEMGFQTIQYNQRAILTENSDISISAYVYPICVSNPSLVPV